MTAMQFTDTFEELLRSYCYVRVVKDNDPLFLSFCAPPRSWKGFTSMAGCAWGSGGRRATKGADSGSHAGVAMAE
jgi:hypothetical protein